MSHNFGLTSASKAGCWIRSTPFFIRKFSTNVDSLLPSPYKHHGTHPIPNRPPTSFTPFSGNSTSESHAQPYEIPNAATPTFGSISSALTITSNSSWKRHHLLLSPELCLYYQSPQLPWSIDLVGCHPTLATASKLRLRGIDFLLNAHSAATLWQISATSTPPLMGRDPATHAEWASAQLHSGALNPLFRTTRERDSLESGRTEHSPSDPEIGECLNLQRP